MKYLVVRSDGLIPAYPVFVLDGHNPAAAPAMFKFAHAAKHLGLPNVGDYFALAEKMRAHSASSPPPLKEEQMMILEAIASPGGKAKLYELERGGHR